MRTRQLQHGGDDVPGVRVHLLPNEHSAHLVAKSSVELLRIAWCEPQRNTTVQMHAHTERALKADAP